MSTEKLLDNRINTFIKDKGESPSRIHLGFDIYCSLLNDCGQNFSKLDSMATHYNGISLELIVNTNKVTSKLIILN